MADEPKIFVNTLMEPELVEKLDSMVRQNGSDRAKLIRWLVEKEWEDRKRTEKLKKALLKTQGEKVIAE